METIGERLKARRKQLGKTLDQVSLETQVPKSTIQRWESGAIKNMGQAGLQKVAVSLNTTINWLLTGEETEDTRQRTMPEVFLFDYLCKKNHFHVSDDRKTIYRKIGKVRITIPVDEKIIQDLTTDTVDYFGYLLQKRYKPLYDETDGQVLVEEDFR